MTTAVRLGYLNEHTARNRSNTRPEFVCYYESMNAGLCDMLPGGATEHASLTEAANAT